MLTCRRCGVRVDGKATWCPCCGKPLSRFGGVSPVLVYIGGILFLAMLLAIGWGILR